MIPRRPDHVSLPLSFAQQRLWVLNQLEPKSSNYNVPLHMRLTGRLQLDALEHSLNSILERHEVLRTKFPSADGQAVQVIAPSSALLLPLIDLQHLASADRDREALRLAYEQLAQPFNLSEGPLLRASLLRLREDVHVLLLTVHHIVFDGWSVNLFLRDLAAFYTSLTTETPVALAPLQIQYADFAYWQRQWLQGETLEDQLGYWKQELGGSLPMLELPLDRSRPPAQTFNGARQTLRLPDTLVKKLKALSRQQSVTFFMTLLAAFDILLYRYTGQDDVIIGVPVAGRGRVEIEELIGFFVNTLALRTDLSGNPTFRELMGRVRETALGAYAHQDLPFEKLVEELQPERTLSQSPLFQVMFQLRNFPTEHGQLPNLKIDDFDFDSRVAKFDITLSMIEDAEGTSAEMMYNTDLFDQATIIRLLNHYQNLLEGIVADPEQRISMLPLLSDKERHQQLVEWNDVKTAYPQKLCIHQLFEAQVERAPDSIAITFGEASLTYAELNKRSNQLARYLRKMGVGPDVSVALYMERSLEMIVGLLGILKAGGAYVPLDPTYPAQRLAFMLKDTRPPVLLAQQQLLKEHLGYDGKIVDLDAEWAFIAKEDAEDLVSANDSSRLAYVMYTSGSKGQPKGVCITHRNVARLVKETDYADLNADEIFLQLAPISFDASTFEIWGSLLNGARLVLMPPQTPTLEELGRALQRYRVTTLWLTAGLFHLMVDERLEDLKHLRQLLAGGDVLSAAHVKKFLREAQGCRLINGYGPTEATTFACCYQIGEPEQITSLVPIGRPIANTEVYILDKHLQPVPIGAHGELYIGGDGLARGYLNRLDLTAEKFIPHPFSKETEARLYKTGDRARYLRDGNIEFLGRLDDQVKIRGFRVELGEIEATLTQHPAVRESVVVAREDFPGDKRIVAYIVARPRCVVTISELRDYLGEKLPEYMIPAAFVMVQSLPLTQNGKIDRMALPPLETEQANEKRVPAPPRTLIEERIVEVWRELLGHEVGIHDNFFELGGHSLLAIQLISRLRESLQLELPLRLLFESPTVALLAQYVEVARQTNCLDDHAAPFTRSAVIALQAGGSQSPFFLLPGENGEAELLGYTNLARYVGLDQPFYGLIAPNFDHEQIPHPRVEEMAADFVREIRAIQPEGPYYLGGYCVGGMLAFEIAHQLEAQNHHVGLLLLIDTLYPTLVPYHLRRFNLNLLSHLQRKIARHVNKLPHLQSTERLPYLLEKARLAAKMMTGGLHSNGDTQEPLQTQSIKEGYLKAVARYRPQKFSGKITLLVSEEMHNRYSNTGWNELASGGLTLRTIPGGHLSCIREHARTTATLLRNCLDEARANGASK